MIDHVSRRAFCLVCLSAFAWYMGRPRTVHAQPAAGSSAVAMPVMAEPVPVRDTTRLAVRLGRGEDQLQPVTWASEPIRIGVLDFRTVSVGPQAIEDINGPGTAIADALAESLGRDGRFQVVRIDLRSGSPDDIAAAVRAGYGPNVDAVLVGELDEVSGTLAGKPLLPFARSGAQTGGTSAEMRLRAGLIDTHNGAMLLKVDANSPVPAGSSLGFAEGKVLASFAGARHSGAETGVAGHVLTSDGTHVTIQLAPGVRVSAGEQFRVRSQGLTKDLATGTLTIAEGTPGSVVRLESASGDHAEGTFDGRLLPKPGDPVELLPAS